MAVPSPMGPQPRRRLEATIVAVSLVVLLAAGCEVNTGGTPPDPEVIIPLLAVPQEDLDRMPASGFVPDMVLLDSTRRLGSVGVADYWVATSKSKEICLAVDATGRGEDTSVSCVPGDQFLESGLNISASDNSGGAWVVAYAYLLPEDVDVAPLEKHLATYILPLDRPSDTSQGRLEQQKAVNLIPVGPGTKTATPIDLDRTGGGKFRFTPFD